MVAVFTGNGLGLFDTSLGVTGGTLSGGAGRDRQGVNVLTGSLVLQGQDELLTYRGLSLGAMRTYNSAGTSVAGADGWLGMESTVTEQGPRNTAGSTVTHRMADGGLFVYTWDAARGKYVCTDGDGAHDTFEWSAADVAWVREDGSTLRREHFELRAGSSEYRISQVRDTRHDGADMARMLFIYDPVVTNRIVEIRTIRTGDTDAGNDAMLFTYDANGRLQRLSLRENGVTSQQVEYGYDGLNRLAYVEVDLTPSVSTDDLWDAVNLANNDSHLYRTSYTYDADTLRIASVTGSDGETTSYTWYANGKVKSVTRPGGETQTFTYTASYTDIVDAQGLRTTWWHYDGRVSTVLGPARDGIRDVTSYTYDDVTHDLVNVDIMRGDTLLFRRDYEYDARGNATSEWDTVGNVVRRTWNAQNQMTSMSTFTIADYDGPGEFNTLQPGGERVTRYVYEASGRRLRFIVGPSGEVTEMRYGTTAGSGSLGQLTETRSYHFAAYAGAADLSALEYWVAGQTSDATLTTLSYDAFGRLATRLEFAHVGAEGDGMIDTAMSMTTFTYDARGLLLKQVTARGAAHPANGGNGATGEVIDYVYDGLGRLLDVIRHDGGTTYVRGVTNPDTLNLAETAGATAAQIAADLATEVTRIRYDDSLMRVTTVTDAGVTRVEQHDAAGHLVSVTESATGVATRTAYNYYDSLGQLRAVADFGGGITYHFYDERGFRVLTVDPTGNVVENEVDTLGRTIRTLQYGRRATTTSWMTGSGATATLNLPTLAGARPTDWLEAFADGVMTELDTTPLSAANGLYIDASGRLAVQRVAQATEGNPRLVTTDVLPLSTGVQFSAEVTTATTAAGSYLIYGLQNGQSDAALRFASAFISDGDLYLHVNIGGQATNTRIGTLEDGKTYVFEAIAGETGLQFRVYLKGQDRNNGFTFGTDIVASEWGRVQLAIGGSVGPGQSGQPTFVDNLRYRVVRQTAYEYDYDGDLISTTDGASTTRYEYDAAHQLLRTVRSASGQPDRVGRQFWNDSGRLIATLDAEGFLTEYVYGAGGRLDRVIRYANAIAVSKREDPTLATMRPTANAGDQVTRYLFDARGRQVGELDAEGYLTETVFDEAGHEVITRRYAQAVMPGGTQSLETLVLEAMWLPPSEPFRETRRAYDDLGRLTSELNHENTLTKFHYDHAGRLVRIEAAANFAGEIRNVGQLFDAFGNLVGELDPNAAMNGPTPRLLESMTYAQKLAIIGQYGTRHEYDAMGRRIESIDRLGNRTWYVYDTAGRQTHVLRGLSVAGVANAAAEVVENRYNPFGEISETLAYTGTLPIGGTRTRTDAMTALATLTYSATVDTRRQFFYDSRGLLIQQTDALAGVSTLRYNGFGELVSSTVPTTITGSPATSTTTTRTYDRRGLVTSTTDAFGSAVARTLTQQLDAFGRATQSTDGRGVPTVFAYDRLGRLVSSQRSTYVGLSGAARVERDVTTYDAFSRVLTQVNALGQTTRYDYSDAARSVTVTTPDGLVTKTERNVHGETFRITAPGGGTTIWTYDLAGNVKTVTDPLGDVTTTEYDVLGRVAATIDDAGTRIEYTYDAVGRVLTRRQDAGSGRLNLLTTWTYDGQGRAVTMLDAAGRTTTTKYDREGRTLEVTRDAGGLNLVTKYTWDAAGRNVKLDEYSNTTLLRTTGYAYDELGRRTSETLDAGGIAAKTTYVYDANDNVVARIDANNVAHYFVYDQANRLIYSMDTLSGTTTPTVAVTRHWYDEAGRSVATRRYATTLTLTAQQVTDLRSATGATMLSTLNTLTNAAKQDSKDAVEYRVFDPAGKLRCVITQIGATSAYLRELRYDSRGNANYELTYTLPRTLSAADQSYFLMQGEIAEGSGVGSAWDRQVRAQALVDSAATTARHRYGVYDAAGNERYVVVLNDAGTAGFVVERQFDHEGRVVAEIRHARTIAPNASATVATVQGQLATATAAEMLVTRYVYDRAGRLRYTIDDSGFAVQQTYDGAGRVVETRRFTAAIAPAVWDEASVLAALAGKTSIRVALNEYDAADRLKKVTDALGGFETYAYNDVANTTTVTDKLGKQTVHTYDDLGRLVSTKDPLNYTESFGYDALGNRTRHTDKNNKIWTFEYDTRGNLTKAVDPLSFFETFTYDALGNRDSYTDKTRTATWNYEFDQLGRMVKEKSPTVSVNRYTSTSGTAITTTSTRIETVIVYDAFGNVTSRTENAAATNASERRTTTYAYDSRGNQTVTTFPRAWEINSSTLVLADTLAATTLEVTYDSLGRAVMQKDTRGGYSYKVYDQLDRVVHDIDAEGYVTSYEYDAAGQQTRLTRRAVKLGANVPAGRASGGAITDASWTSAINALAAAGNRVVVTKYDDAGRKIEVQTTAANIEYWTSTSVQSQGIPTTKFEYDAAGHLVKERVLIEKLGTTEVYAETWHWYDAAGQRTHTVDPEKYLTKWTYDANGRELSRTEFARAVTTLNISTPPANPAAGTAAIGFDRQVSWLYDDGGRRWKETISALRYQTATGTTTSGDFVTTFEFDKEGRNTKITVDDPTAAATVSTTNVYDALGRLTSVTEQARSVLKERWNADGTLAADDWRVLLRNGGNTIDSAALYETISPLTRMDYDAFGNVVRVSRPGRGTAGSQAQTDQTTTTRYDYQGRAVVNVDAEGVATYSQYNAADQATRVFYDLANGTGGVVRIMERISYDLIGRMTERYVDRNGVSAADAGEAVAYNAFGEITAKAWTLADLGNAAKRIDYGYDAAGRMTDSDEAGVNRRYRYNLAGQQVAELRDPTGTHLTRMVLDKLGRATTTYLPAYDSAGTVTTILRTYDRWGNVLTQTDARGGVTEWTYNSRDQALTQKAPAVTYYGADGLAVTNGRPETQWWYDSNGRLIGIRDANGNTDTNEYDAVGRLTKSFDALHYATKHAYDGFGRDRVQQNALGYLTTNSYDRRDRVVGVGDYLMAGTNRTDLVREAYALNRNGDRITVTNGEAEVQRYNYDSRGLLVRSQSAMGVIKDFAYDAAGNRKTETYAPGTAQAVSQSWVYDVHNRLVDHIDLGGNNFDYGFDSEGRLANETSTNMAIYAEDLDNDGNFNYTVIGSLARTTTYYANGLVKQINYSATEYTYYEYDANGNRTLEKTVKAAKAKTATSPGMPGVNIETRITYDSHNRITLVTTDDFLQQADFGKTRMMTAEYKYDAVGNRRYAKITNGFALGYLAEHVQEGWYSYDGENRVLVEAGGLANGVIYRYPTVTNSWTSVSAENAYDELGRLSWRKTAELDLSNWFDSNATRTESFTYSLRGERITSTSYLQSNDVFGNPYTVSGSNSSSVYDKAGRLVEAVEYFPWGSTAHISSGDVPLTGVVRSGTAYTYDDDGRVVSQVKWGRKAGTTNGSVTWAIPLGTAPSSIHFSWSATNNATGLVKLEETQYLKANSSVSGYDTLGRLVEYRYTRWAQEYNAPSPGGNEIYTHSFVTTFVARDAFLDGKTSATTSNSDFKATSTQNWYDAAGRHHFIEDHTYIKGAPDPRTRRQMVFNGDGQILLRMREYRSGDNSWQQGQDEGQFDLTNMWEEKFTQTQWANLAESERERWYDKRDNARAYFANGQQIASVNEAGQDLLGVQYLTGFTNSSVGRGRILVQEGDTLQSLAQRAYGTTTMWYVIAEANGLGSPTEELPGGTTLALPEVRTSTNDYKTFKPYDPSEITGPTTPSLPYMPPPDQGCGAVGQIIMLVVIIIVTVYTAGAAAGALGVTGTTAGAAAGTTVAASTASIGASALAGTAVGGVTLGATAGSLAAASMTGALMASAAVGAFVGTAVGTALGSAMGVASFSWKGALASGAAAGLTAGLGSTNMVSNLAGSSRFMNGALGSLSNSLIGQATNRAFGVETSFSWKSIAVSAVSAGVGNAMAPYIGRGLEKAGVDLATENGQSLLEFSNEMAGGLVSAHLSRAVGLTKEINAGNIAAMAFASTVANRITGRHAAAAAMVEAERARGDLVAGQVDGLSTAVRRKAAAEGVDLRTMSGRDLQEYVRGALSNIPELMALGGDDDSEFGPYAATGLADSVGASGLPTVSDQLTFGLNIALNPIAKTKMAFGFFAGVLGSVVDDGKAFGGAVIGVMEAKADLEHVVAQGVMNHFGYEMDPVETAEYQGALDRTLRRVEALTYIANNLPTVVKEGVLAEVAEVQADWGMFEQSVNDQDYVFAGIAAGRLAYKIVPVLLGLGAAARTGLTLAKMGVRKLDDVLQAMTSSVARHADELPAPSGRSMPEGAPSAPATTGTAINGSPGTSANPTSSASTGRTGAKRASAAAAAAAGVRVLKTYRAGNRLIEFNGRLYNVPKGFDLSKLPTSDRVGDLLQTATTDAAARWNPRRHLTANERDAISEARQAGEHWRANLLEKQAKGRWVEAEVRVDPRLDDLDLDWQRRGVDVTDRGTGRTYDLLSATRSNIDRHARRMHDQLFRMIGF